MKIDLIKIYLSAFCKMSLISRLRDFGRENGMLISSDLVQTINNQYASHRAYLQSRYNYNHSYNCNYQYHKLTERELIYFKCSNFEDLPDYLKVERLDRENELACRIANLRKSGRTRRRH